MQSLSPEQWATQLLRWSQLPHHMGEVKLLCAVLGSAIAEEPSLARLQAREPYHGGFFGRGFENYCRALALQPDFIREQIARANQFIANANLDSASREDNESEALALA